MNSNEKTITPSTELIAIKEKHLSIGTAKLSLVEKERARLLFEAIMKKPDLSITKFEILENVFGLSKNAYLQKSPLFKRSIGHNVIKLLSRCRIICEDLAKNQNLEEIDFFYHCKKRNRWSLAVKHVAYKASFEDELEAS